MFQFSFSNLPGSNLLCWLIEITADILAVVVAPYNYLLAMAINIFLSCGLTPLVYLANTPITSIATTREKQK